MLLPAPHAHDLFFDLEGNPLAPAGPREYLWGWGEIACDGRFGHHVEWAHDASAEKAAPEHFVELALARLDAHPAFHLYHFGAYEPTALTRLMGRYGTREEGVDRLLRAGVFVDLYTVTRQSVVISRESCSFKDLELLYRDGPREGAVAQAMDSVVAYHRWQLEQNPETLADIAAYHAEDCRSTWELRHWLEELREEVERQAGPLPRPELRTGEPSARVRATDHARLQLRERLLTALPADPSRWEEADRAQSLPAELLLFHRREARPMWRRHFQYQTDTDEDFLDDAETLGGLTLLAGDTTGWLFHFDGSQEFKMRRSDRVMDPSTGQEIGEIERLDPGEEIVVVRPATMWAEAPTALARLRPRTPAVWRRSSAAWPSGPWVRVAWTVRGLMPLSAACCADSRDRPGTRHRLPSRTASSAPADGRRGFTPATWLGKGLRVRAKPLPPPASLSTCWRSAAGWASPGSAMPSSASCRTPPWSRRKAAASPPCKKGRSGTRPAAVRK